MKRSITSYFLLFFSVFFFLFSTNNHNVHNILHKHEGDACNNEVEDDPCHQKIFHNKASAECNHHDHLHSPKETCELCDAILYTVSIDAEIPFDSYKQSYIESKVLYTDAFHSRYQQLTNQVRGPPSLKLI